MKIKKETSQIINNIYAIHDVHCNQKYDKIYPYSLHLKAVVAQAYKYKHLIDESIVGDVEDIYIAAAGHDLIEDARLTYNDVVQSYGKLVADIIYACTELRGHDRPERHGEEYFLVLSKLRPAVFIKLCDIMANVLYSILTNSSMYEKYQKEFPWLYENLHIVGEFEELWDDLRELLKM
jgi:(p)ppGpp synthase/HD superfamily hydrolase